MYIEQYDIDHCMVDFNNAENASLSPKKLFEYFSIIPQFQFLPAFDPANRKPVTFATFRNNKLIFKNGLLRYFIGKISKYGIKATYDPRLKDSNKNIILNGYALSVDEFASWCNEYYSDSKYDPRDHQIAGGVEIINRRRSVSEFCTRAGKTLLSHMIFSYIIDFRKKYNKKTNCLMLVPSKLLASQGESDFKDYIESTSVVNLGTYKPYLKAKTQGEKRSVILECMKEYDIIISTYQSWRSFTDLTIRFACIFIDECHGSGANSYVSILKDIHPQAMVFGMTGTLPTDQIERMKIESNIFNSIYQVKTEDLQDVGLLCDIDVNCYTVDFDYEDEASPAYSGLEDAISYGSELLSYIEKKKDKDGNEYEERRLPAYLVPLMKMEDRIELYHTICEHINLTKKESGNASLLLRFEQGLARRSSYKKKLLYKVVDNIKRERHNGTILLLCVTVDYTVELANELKEIYGDKARIWRITGNVPPKQRTMILGTVNSKRDEDMFDIIVGSYGTMSTGITIPYLTDVLLVEGYKSGILNNQSVGRALGKYEGKDRAYIHDFADIFYTGCLAKHRSDRLKIYNEGKKCTINYCDVDL